MWLLVLLTLPALPVKGYTAFTPPVYHGLLNLRAALNYYQKAMTLSGNLPYYFAPNAALQLGYLALGAL